MIYLETEPGCNFLKDENLNKYQIMRRTGNTSHKALTVSGHEMRSFIAEFLAERAKARQEAKAQMQKDNENINKAANNLPAVALKQVNGSIVTSFITEFNDNKLIHDSLVINNNYLPSDDLAPARVDAIMEELHIALNIYHAYIAKKMEDCSTEVIYSLFEGRLYDRQTNTFIDDKAILDNNKVKATVRALTIASIGDHRLDKKMKTKEQFTPVNINGKYIKSIQFAIKESKRQVKADDGKYYTVPVSQIVTGIIVSTTEAREIVKQVAKWLPVINEKADTIINQEAVNQAA